MSDAIVYVSDATFESEVLQSNTPVLVDYWAEWCGPCKMIAPILDDVAKEYSGKLKVAKLNIDENQDTPPKYGIRGIPTLMLFKNGNVEVPRSVPCPKPNWRRLLTPTFNCIIRLTRACERPILPLPVKSASIPNPWMSFSATPLQRIPTT